MGVNLYLSTDASAPVLTGSVGSLAALLDAILVNGYGAKAGAGWTIAYTGTNKRDYKQGAGSNGYYLDVDDSGPGSGGAREARMRGYEAMTALGTGTMAFPLVSQMSTGLFCRKSTSADSTARVWYCVADSTCFYLFVETGDITGPVYPMAFSFGDIFTNMSGDVYSTLIMGRSTENSASGSLDWVCSCNYGLSACNPLYGGNYTGGNYMNRIWTGVGGSIPVSKFTSMLAYTGTNTTANGSPGGNAALLAYPNGPDSGLELSPIWIGHNNSVRGYLKGLWAPCHNQPLAHAQQFSGTGNMAGKSFLALNCVSNNNYGPLQGQIILETSNTWS